MDMHLLLQVGGYLLTFFGGAAALETSLENFVMPKVPAAYRWLMVPAITFGAAIITSLLGGADIHTALQVALAGWGATAAIHNHPGLTSADWAIGPPPELPTADAIGFHAGTVEDTEP